MNDASSVRPTKKQRELLTFIEAFIAAHGYSPSYREIMVGCDYTSVATVALHIRSLMARGHIRKRDRSARSLEVVTASTPADATTVHSNTVAPAEEKWLVEKVEYYVAQAESQAVITQATFDELYVLTAALRVLGLDGAAQSFAPRLQVLRQHLTDAA